MIKGFRNLPWLRSTQERGALGLDRSPQGSWRAVELVCDAGRGLRLRNAAVLEASISEGDVPEPEALRLLAWLSAAGISEKVTVGGLSLQEVQLRRVQVPVGLHEAELEQLALTEGARIYGQPAGRCCVDFSVLGPAPHAPGELDVLLVAAPRDTVLARQQLMLASGLELQVLELSRHAARAAAVHAWRAVTPDAGLLQALVLWHEGAASVLGLRDGQVVEDGELPARTLDELPHAWAAQARSSPLGDAGAVWLAADAPVDADLAGTVGMLAATGGVLHPFAGLKMEDAALRKLSPDQAALWWTACGLALRGVHAWSC